MGNRSGERRVAARRCAWSGAAALAIVGALGSGGCGSRHIVLSRQDPSAPTGPLQRCEVGQTSCAAAPEDDAARFTDSNALSFALPECGNGGIQRIDIRDVGSDRPVVIVQCAAPDVVLEVASPPPEPPTSEPVPGPAEVQP